MGRFFCLLMLVLAACAPVDFDAAERGTFKGEVTLVWVGPNDSPYLGDGKFLYVPMPGQQLVFERGENADASAGAEIIIPEAFFTDGGSVPRVVQAFPGMNAWAYGPAYVVHDWVFVARKCLNDDMASPVMTKLKNMTFSESALLMAETIKTLTSDENLPGYDPVSERVITSATAGPVSRGLWNETGSCTLQIPGEDYDQLIADLTGGAARLERAGRGAFTVSNPYRVSDKEVAFVLPIVSGR